MKIHKSVLRRLVFETLSGRPSGKKFTMSKDQKILEKRNTCAVKRFHFERRTHVHCEKSYTSKILHCQHIALSKVYSVGNYTVKIIVRGQEIFMVKKEMVL